MEAGSVGESRISLFFIGLFGASVSREVELCGSLIFNFQVCVLWDFPGVNNFKSAAVDKKWLHLQQTNYLYFTHTYIVGEDMEKCNAVINCLKPISTSSDTAIQKYERIALMPSFGFFYKDLLLLNTYSASCLLHH